MTTRLARSNAPRYIVKIVSSISGASQQNAAGTLFPLDDLRIFW